MLVRCKQSSKQFKREKMNELVFIKLGGSLITDKSTPLTPNLKSIQFLSAELAKLFKNHPDTQFILGHGSGSFGHFVANQYQTRKGVYSDEQWIGFLEVWQAVRELNNLVIQELQKFNIPCISIPPSVTFLAENGKPKKFFYEVIDQAIKAKLIPVVFGDVVFDTFINGTIFSTEDVFFYLAHRYKPGKILLAGIEDGIFSDFPRNKCLIELLTPENFPNLKKSIGKSTNTDVTGGMLDKVTTMIELLKDLPDLKIAVFSGSQPEIFEKAMAHQKIGTWIEQE